MVFHSVVQAIGDMTTENCCFLGDVKKKMVDRRKELYYTVGEGDVTHVENEIDGTVRTAPRVRCGG
jgi:hypothetical protein